MADEGVRGRSLPVFEFASDAGSVRVELPLRWARRHSGVVVAFMDGSSELGWHAHLVGDDGNVLLSFPWCDHVDRVLREGGGELPIVAADDPWDDLEQGWWGWVKGDGDDVFVAETDLDALSRVRPSPTVELIRAGIVVADGVEVSWSCVDRSRYDRAWRDAVAACRGGSPSPVCEWISAPDVARRVRLRR